MCADGRKGGQAGRKRGRDGAFGVWMGAGTLEKSRCKNEKETRPRKRGKKALTEVCSAGETRLTDG